MMTIPQPSLRVSKVATLVNDMARDRNQLSALKSALGELSGWTIAEVRELLDQLSRVDASTSSVQLALETILQALAAGLKPPLPTAHPTRSEIDELLSGLQRLYVHVSPASAVRNYILRLMAMGGSVLSLGQLAENLVDDPPEHVASLGLAFAPLVSLPQPNFQVLFPRLLDGLQHLNLAAAILDVANHAFVAKKVAAHPAAIRVAALNSLLGNFVDKVSELERSPPSTKPLRDMRQVVADSVALVVSISRTLGLIGELSAQSQLKRALILRHRRIRAEVAGALAMLGDAQGITELVELAQWPVARLRALAYADELGLIDRVDPKFRTDVARAESQLAVWLAEPTQFGLAPMEMKLLDERELFWPGYDDAQPCFLFRFVYPAMQGEWSNIGISGTITHATSASLEHLTFEEIYALFAGWQTTHHEIYEIDLQYLANRQKESIARQQAGLADEGYADIRLAFIGRFFGEEFAIASATKDQMPGHLIWSDRETFWLVDDGKQLTSELAYCQFKGQKLLASFNPEFGSSTASKF